jgi:hypothetical protein
MRPTKLFIATVILATSSALCAQSPSLSSSSLASGTDSGPDYEATPSSEGGGGVTLPGTVYAASSTRPFSRVAFGVAPSPLGIQLQVTSNLVPHVNLRARGNMFNYSTNITTSGITSNAKVNMRSAGASVDIYPFRAGFRISPGLLFYNGNQVTASAGVAGGTSFTLNNQKYYSATANPTTGATPVNGNALLNLHTTNPAFTITGGWGNTLPTKGHWSFPFEAGVALTGAPSLNMNLGGWACYDPAQTVCTNINSKTDPIAVQIQDNLHAQVAKWTNDLEPLKTYPSASFGVSYSFRVGNVR